MGKKFIDDVSEVRIKETSEKDMENDSVSNVFESAEAEEISLRSESQHLIRPVVA